MGSRNHLRTIHSAAKNGDRQLLQNYRTEAGDDEIFRRECEFLQCLHTAAENGRIDVLRFLVEDLKVDTELKNDDGYAALLQAAKKESLEAATYLINHGADVNARGYRGYTCLHIAAIRGNIALMDLLLRKGADINAVSALGTPLIPAATHGGVEAVRFLLNHGADPNAISPNFITLLIGALAGNSDECVVELLQADADPNIELHGPSPLAMAVTFSTSMARILIDAGANPITATRSISHTYSHVLKLMDTAASSRISQNYHNAMILYTEASHFEPDNLHEVFYYRSICYQQLGEFDCSLYDAEKSIKLNQSRPEYYSRAGEVCVLLENFVKACRFFKLAKSLGPATELALSMGPGIADIKEKHRFALKKLILKYAQFDLPRAIDLLQEHVSYSEAYYTDIRDIADREPLRAVETLKKIMDGQEILNAL